MLDLETAAGLQAIPLKAGMIAVVPQNAWHRFRAPKGVTLMSLTPMPSDFVRTETEDPRTV